VILSRFSSLERDRGIRLPLEDSNLDYPIQSAGPRATKTDKLTGSGVPTSIGALSVSHRCPLLPGEPLVKHLQEALLTIGQARVVSPEDSVGV